MTAHLQAVPDDAAIDIHAAERGAAAMLTALGADLTDEALRDDPATRQEFLALTRA